MHTFNLSFKFIFPQILGTTAQPHTQKRLFILDFLSSDQKIFHSHLSLLSYLCSEIAILRLPLSLFKDVELQLKFIATFPST